MNTRISACWAVAALVCGGLIGSPQRALAGQPTEGAKPQTADTAKPGVKLLESKLSPDLLALYQCSQNHATNAEGRTCALPPSGNVGVEVQLAPGVSEDQKVALQLRLTTAGLNLKSDEGATSLTGEIAISQLESLVQIAEVSSVSNFQQQPRPRRFRPD